MVHLVPEVQHKMKRDESEAHMGTGGGGWYVFPPG